MIFFAMRPFLLFLLPLIAYSFMLASPFKTMDDQFSIVGNPLIKDTAQWPQLFTKGYFNDHSYYRPLANLSFMAEYKLFGLNSFFYNLDNLLIHIANAFLVWLLVSWLVSVEVGFWTALLFAIHPIQWESVANISGRAILLSTTFGLLSFIAFVKERQALAFICFAVALLCKESSAVLPGILAVYSWLNRRSLKWLWAWAGLVAAYIWLRRHLGITEVFPWRNTQESILGFLTFLHSVLIDLRLFIFPTDMHFDRSLKLFSSLDQPAVLLTIGAWLAVLFLIFFLRHRFTRLHWLALVWFGLALAPVSQIITTIGVGPGYISMAEHFLYFACIPVFMVIAEIFTAVKVPLLKLAGLGFLAFFFLTTAEQNIYARSELAMMERSLHFQPHNARLQSSVGLIYALSGKFTQAEGYFRAAVTDDPFNARYRISLGKSLCDQGRVQECLDTYDQITEAGSLAALLRDNRRAAEALLRNPEHIK